MNNSYVAGLFDGEGCIIIRRGRHKGSRYPQYSIACTIAMTDPRPLKRIAHRFGGSVCSPPSATKGYDPSRKKTVFRWTVVSRTAAHFLEQIVPSLLVKRAEAMVALRFQKHLDSVRRGHRVMVDGKHCYPEHIRERRERLYAQLQALKRRQFQLYPVGPTGLEAGLNIVMT